MLFLFFYVSSLFLVIKFYLEDTNAYSIIRNKDLIHGEVQTVSVDKDPIIYWLVTKNKDLADVESPEISSHARIACSKDECFNYIYPRF